LLGINQISVAFGFGREPPGQELDPRGRRVPLTDCSRAEWLSRAETYRPVGCGKTPQVPPSSLFLRPPGPPSRGPL